MPSLSRTPPVVLTVWARRCVAPPSPKARSRTASVCATDARSAGWKLAGGVSHRRVQTLTPPGDTWALVGWTQLAAGFRSSAQRSDGKGDERRVDVWFLAPANTSPRSSVAVLECPRTFFAASSPSPPNARRGIKLSGANVIVAQNSAVVGAMDAGATSGGLAFRIRYAHIVNDRPDAQGLYSTVVGVLRHRLCFPGQFQCEVCSASPRWWLYRKRQWESAFSGCQTPATRLGKHVRAFKIHSFPSSGERRWQVLTG
jgi:hypothetical protein